MHLHSILRGAHAFLAPSAAVAGLAPDIAGAKPASVPHSIAEIVAHMAFWQDWFLDRSDGNAVQPPAHAALGWPAVGAGEWEAVLNRFETGYKRALALADDAARTARPVTPAIEFEPLSKYTVGDVLVHVALHNAHHVGQVVTLRQQLGGWPPPAGSFTW
jgi:uncharacterized damage-inducible protein DinB